MNLFRRLFVAANTEPAPPAPDHTNSKESTDEWSTAVAPEDDALVAGTEPEATVEISVGHSDNLLHAFEPEPAANFYLKLEVDDDLPSGGSPPSADAALAPADEGGTEPLSYKEANFYWNAFGGAEGPEDDDGPADSFAAESAHAGESAHYDMGSPYLKQALFQNKAVDGDDEPTDSLASAPEADGTLEAVVIPRDDQFADSLVAGSRAAPPDLDTLADGDADPSAGTPTLGDVVVVKELDRANASDDPHTPGPTAPGEPATGAEPTIVPDDEPEPLYPIYMNYDDGPVKGDTAAAPDDSGGGPALLGGQTSEPIDTERELVDALQSQFLSVKMEDALVSSYQTGADDDEQPSTLVDLSRGSQGTPAAEERIATEAFLETTDADEFEEPEF